MCLYKYTQSWNDRKCTWILSVPFVWFSFIIFFSIFFYMYLIQQLCMLHTNAPWIWDSWDTTLQSGNVCFYLFVLYSSLFACVCMRKCKLKSQFRHLLTLKFFHNCRIFFLLQKTHIFVHAQVWSNVWESKWQKFHFWVNNPFKKTE